jgi:hypothetical protein
MIFAFLGEDAVEDAVSVTEDSLVVTDFLGFRQRPLQGVRGLRESGVEVMVCRRDTFVFAHCDARARRRSMEGASGRSASQRA